MRLYSILLSVLFVSLSLNADAQKMAPSFTLKNDKGEMVSLSDFRGKVVYLSFWASWCAPCKKIFANSRGIRDTLAEEGVVLLNISLDKDPKKWDDAMFMFDIPGIHLIENPEKTVQFEYDVRSVPAFYIINKRGELETLTGGGIDGALADFRGWLAE